MTEHVYALGPPAVAAKTAEDAARTPRRHSPGAMNPDRLGRPMNEIGARSKIASYASDRRERLRRRQVRLRTRASSCAADPCGRNRVIARISCPGRGGFPHSRRGVRVIRVRPIVADTAGGGGARLFHPALSSFDAFRPGPSRAAPSPLGFPVRVPLAAFSSRASASRARFVLAADGTLPFDCNPPRQPPVAARRPWSVQSDDVIAHQRTGSSRPERRVRPRKETSSYAQPLSLHGYVVAKPGRRPAARTEGWG